MLVHRISAVTWDRALFSGSAVSRKQSVRMTHSKIKVRIERNKALIKTEVRDLKGRT